ncbi:MAG TPA: hypothetical protein VM802_13070 [Chitinophaga sp.]|uniref:hypothetical protein n=1 Tax=Chitinophaga sp. TaxID=1869181 RepID=UPI002C35BE0A|nr:hypothetical protein [Chitinophaga sp.]HVI45800.1 hypothetical protein [Chitinophaga sp.]
MKIYQYFLLIVAASTLFFSACRKDVADKLPGGNVGARKATVEGVPKWLLSKVIYTTKDNDFNWTATYAYNSQNKPISKQVKGKRYTTLFDETILFFYDNAGRISKYKSTNRLDTVNITYDVQGRLLKGQYTYNYPNDSVAYINYTVRGPKGWSGYIVYYFYDSNRNLKQIREFDDQFGPLTDTLPGYPTIVTTFTKYDNKANVNEAINVDPTWLTSYQYQSEASRHASAPFNSRNNFQEFSYNLNSNVVKQTATYNADGLVTRLDGVSAVEYSNRSYVYRFEYVLAK